MLHKYSLHDDFCKGMPYKEEHSLILGMQIDDDDDDYGR